MPIRTSEIKSLTGGLLVAALLGMPLVGCGGDDDDDDSTNTSTPTPGSGTPTQSQGTPTPGGNTDGVFPSGQYYYTFAYVLNFQSLPYVLTQAGYTWDAAHAPRGAEASGDWEGQNVLVVWNTRTAYQAGEDPDCYVYEEVVATNHVSGTDTEVDYGTCEFCDPFADYFSDADLDDDDLPDNVEGCEQDFIDAWYYYDDVGEYDYTFGQYEGYRHAATDGWPGAFTDLVDSLEGAGYVGTIYDQFTDLVVNGEVNFSPGYFVKPTDLSARPVAGKIPVDTRNLQEVTLPSFEEFRRQYRAFRGR